MNTITFPTKQLRSQTYRLVFLLLLFSGSLCLGARTMTFFNNTGFPPFVNPAPAAYSNPLNWSGGYPGETIAFGDIVIINGGCEMDVTVTNNGTIKIERDIFPGDYKLIVMPGYTLTNSGRIDIGPQGTSWVNKLIIRGNLNNTGISSFNGIENNGEFINEGGIINNRPNSSINLRAGGSFHNHSGTFNNYGTLSQQGTFTNLGTTNMYDDSFFAIWAPTSAITQGTFTWFGGRIDVNAGQTLTIEAGKTLSQPASGILNSWGTININGSGDLAGTVKINAGTLNIGAGSSLNQSSGLIESWGTINISGDYESASSLVIYAGQVNINNSAKYTRKVGGRITGRLILKSYGELVLEDDTPLPAAFGWQEEGTVTIAGNYYASINVPIGCYLDIAPTGVYQLGQLTNTTLTINHATNVTNRGTIRLMNGGKILILALNAALPKNSGATFTWDSGGEVSTSTNSTLYVDPSITVPVGGILNVNGKLSIATSFTVAGTLNLWSSSAEVIGSPNLNISGKMVYVNEGLPATRDLPSFPVNFMHYSILEVQSRITLNIPTEQSFSRLNNAGTININNGGNLISKGALNPFGQLVGALNNYGTLNLNTGGKLTFNTVDKIPGGIFNWNPAGIVEVGLQGRLEVDSNPSVTIPSGSELSVLGSLVSISTGTFITNNGILRNAGTVELNSIWMQNNGTFLNNGTLSVNPEGHLYNSNMLTNGGIINLNADSRLTQDGTLTNTGSLNLNNDGRLILSNATAISSAGNFNWNEGGKLFIEADATLSLASQLTIPRNADLFIIGNLSILPAATLDVSEGASLQNFGTILNTGMLNLNTGSELIIHQSVTELLSGDFNWFAGAEVTIANGGNYTPSAEFTVPTGGTLFVDGTFTNPVNNNFILDGDVSLKGTGELINDGTLDIKGTLSNTFAGGAVNNSTTGQINIFSTGKLFNSETVTFLNQQGGTVSNAGKIYNIVDATLANEGEITILAGGSIISYGNSVLLNEGTLTNSGAISNGGAFFTNSGTFTNLNTFDNNYSGTASNSGLWQDETDLSINRLNNGTFNLLAGGNYQMNAPDTQWPKGTFNWGANSEVTVGEASTVAYPGFSELEIDTDRTLIINGQLIMESARSFNRGTITGTGLFSAYIDFLETGVIAPGNGVGELTFEGILNLNDGTYACEIGGGFTNPADLLIIDGTPRLEYGKLLVTWISPPVHEARYTVMTYIGGPTASYFDPEDIIIPEVEGFTFEKIITASEVIIVASQTTALPVELMQFTATKSGKVAFLEWQTATEQNNEGFSIERLNTPTNLWEEIGFTQGAGTSTAPQAYDFTDLAPQSGENFYRLRQVDFSGDFTYSAVVSATFNERSELVVYPNPVSTHLRVMNAEGQEYQIFNTVGQVMLSGINVSEIDVSALLPGSYLLKVGAETKRFLKR